MERTNILTELNQLFIRIMGNTHIRLTEDTCDKDIDDWESMMHIQLIDAIERYYKIRFTTPEIQSPRTVNNLINLIQFKLNKMG